MLPRSTLAAVTVALSEGWSEQNIVALESKNGIHYKDQQAEA
jgi:hypothetical protein